MLRNSADVLLEENWEKNDGPNSVSQPFVGTDGIMSKLTTVHAVKNYENLEGKGTVLDTTSYQFIVDGASNNTQPDNISVSLPKIQVLLVTKSAEVGINGKYI